MLFNVEKGLRRLKGKVKPIKIFGFDIETYNNNKNFLCGSIVGDNYEKFFENKEDMKKEFSSNQDFRNSYLVATNLMFDFFGIFEIEEGIKNFSLIERGSNLILAKTHFNYLKSDNNYYSMDALKIKKRELRRKNIYIDIGKNFYPVSFIDSGNHLRSSVANLGKIIGIDKMKAPSCLGHKPKTKSEMEYMKKYNIRDSLVTYSFMKWLQEKYNSIGSNMKSTISSTALDLFRREFHKGFWKQEEREQILFNYKGFYGGRTEAFKRGVFDADNYGRINVYDVNSLYPYCLEHFKYPYVNDGYYKKKIIVSDIDSFEGIAKFKLKSPRDINIPLVPLRADKLLFPLGTIEGTYDFNTIRHAINRGYEIIETGEGVIYENTFAPFRGFVRSLWKLRKEFKKRGDSSELVAKILMNSFFGKLGYNFSNKESLVFEKDLCNYDLDDFTIYPTGNKNVFRLLNTINCDIPSYVFPSIPAYVTSYARSYMFKKYIQTGEDRVLYTDTDCIFTNRKLSDSDELGELGFENNYNSVCIVKPKFYAGKMYSYKKDGKIIKTEDGKDEVMKVKGMHNRNLSYSNFMKMINKGKLISNGIHFRKLRTALAGKGYVNEVFEMVKEMQLNDTKRIWDKELFTTIPQNSIPITIK